MVQPQGFVGLYSEVVAGLCAQQFVELRKRFSCSCSVLWNLSRYLRVKVTVGVLRLVIRSSSEVAAETFIEL